jgi:glycosyltransferase involved in cell wall biosynthesis
MCFGKLPANATRGYIFLKVLHVIPWVSPVRGGPALVVRMIAQSVADCGWDVDIATTDDNGPGRLNVPLGVPVIDHGVTYWYFRRQTSFYNCSLPLGRWLWNNLANYNLVHIHALFSYSSTVAAWIAGKKHIPYIVRPFGVLNQWGMQNRRPLLKRLSFRLCERNILEGAAAVQYTSEQERQEAEQLDFHAPSAIIPNPVDLPDQAGAQRGRLRAKYPQLADKVIFLFLSRVDEKKGLDLLLPAFARVRAQFPQTALVIAGSGSAPLVSGLQELARRHKIEADVVWAGFVQGADKNNALADADVFVLPSYSENFGVAAVEAMSFQLPLIVSDQVGIHDRISSCRAGLVTACDVGALSEAMMKLAADQALRQEMGRNGFSLAKTAFHSEVVTHQLIELYRKL